MDFTYYYGDESGQFSYFRIPRQLVTGGQFRRLSTDAKLLYGLLLDRMGLSAKNGWYDKLGRVFIYYTLDEIQADLNCGHDKATKLLVDLDIGKGIGLIERVRQGQGKPTRIYVKRFTTGQIPPQLQRPQGFPPSSSPEYGKPAAQSAENPQVSILTLTKLILVLLSHLSIHLDHPRQADGWIEAIAGEKLRIKLSLLIFAASSTMRILTAW